MNWRLSEAKERARYDGSPLIRAMKQMAHDDCARLLALVDRMRPYLDHKWVCAVSRELNNNKPVVSPCDCGLAGLRRELEGR